MDYDLRFTNYELRKSKIKHIYRIITAPQKISIDEYVLIVLLLRRIRYFGGMKTAFLLLVPMRLIRLS